MSGRSAVLVRAAKAQREAEPHRLQSNLNNESNISDKERMIHSLTPGIWLVWKKIKFERIERKLGKKGDLCFGLPWIFVGSSAPFFELETPPTHYRNKQSRGKRSCFWWKHSLLFPVLLLFLLLERHNDINCVKFSLNAPVIVKGEEMEAARGRERERVGFQEGKNNDPGKLIHPRITKRYNDNLLDSFGREK